MDGLYKKKADDRCSLKFGTERVKDEGWVWCTHAQIKKNIYIC